MLVELKAICRICRRGKGMLRLNFKMQYEGGEVEHSDIKGTHLNIRENR